MGDLGYNLKMQLKDVENLAELARIEISEEEKQAILKDMEGILGYVKQIEGVELEDFEIEHSSYNSWREDEPTDRDFSLDSIKKQFPDSQGDFLKVKKIL